MGTTRQVGDGDLGDSLTIESLLLDVKDLKDLNGTAAHPEASGTLPQPEVPGLQSALERTVDDGSLNRLAEQDRVARLRTAAKARQEGSASLPALDLRSALQIFCRGAGIDPDRLSLRDEPQLLQLAGRMLRETLLGLKEILRAQQAFVDNNGIERQVPEGRSPLDANMDEYLLELLAGHEKRQFDAVMRLRDQFTHAGRHAAAIDPALRSALQQFLGHLAPERLAVGQDAAASWNRYRDVYGNLLQASGGRLPHLFLEALAQTYQEARGRD
jgi:predicted component of type VI protein secretion system